MAGKSAAQARALALLRQVGLEESAADAGAALGGQQQRVAIARAPASSPQIILFDEPTGARPEMIGEVLQVMKTGPQRDHHAGGDPRDTVAREIADRVVFIDGGDILEVAPPAEFSPIRSMPAHGVFCRRCWIRCTVRRASSDADA